MKYLISILFVFLLFPGIAQQKEPADIELTGSPFGLYIKMKDPVQTGYKVLRREKGGTFKMIGDYKSAITASDLYRRMTYFANIFPNFAAPNPTFVDTIWSRYQTDKGALTRISYPLLQLALGNAFLDTSAIVGKTYQYKMIFPNTEKKLTTRVATYNLLQPEYSKMKLSKVKNVGRSVRLEWTSSALNPPPFFEVYRKQAAGKNVFRRIEVERGTHNSKTGDSTVFIAIDTTGILGISYDYFLTSVSYLGNEGNHSDTVRLQLGGRQNVPSVYNLRTRSDSNGIRLSWRALVPNPSLNNILVLRSSHYDTGYKLLTTLPVKETHFIDRDVDGGKLYYYQLIVQGAANYSIPTPRVSGKFMGKIRLNAPYDLQSRSLEGGIALAWRYRDTGRIKGFKVYRSLHPRQNFEFIGEIVAVPKDTTLMHFTDTTLANENTTYYYAVAAVSRTSNLSPSSLVVSGKSLRKTTLSAPIGLRSLWLNDSVVSVSWKDMELQIPGVTGYKIYRNEEDLETVSNQYLWDSVTINEFTDTLSPGESSWYWVKAKDVQGRSGSVSPPIRIQAPIDRPLPPDVQLYKQKQSIILSWEPSLNNSIKKYNIYRAAGENTVALVGTVEANRGMMRYTDKKVEGGTLYFYYVTSVDRHEVESSQSDEVHVRIK